MSERILDHERSAPGASQECLRVLNEKKVLLLSTCLTTYLEPYTVLRDGVFAHPTLARSLNDLFSTLYE